MHEDVCEADRTEGTASMGNGVVSY